MEKKKQLWGLSPKPEKKIMDTLRMSIKDDQTSLFLLKKKIIDKSRLFQSTTASNEAFYAKAMLHILSGMPHHVQGMYHSFQWKMQNSNATLQLVSKHTTVSSEYCVD